MNNDLDFDKDIAINDSDLVEELRKQPQLYYKWSKKAAYSEFDSGTAKDKLDIIKSEVELRIRKNPQLHGLTDKPTEAQVKAVVNTNRKVIKAQKNFRKAVRIEKIFSKAERAFEHRKKSLEGLVYINQRLYFASPKTDRQTQQEVDEKSLISQARTKRNIKRREK